MFQVYIIYSKKLNKFYIGTTNDFEARLEKHNNENNLDSFSYRGRPWTHYLVILGLTSKQAYDIEDHIKAMKSKKYIENLLKYPEMVEKLKYQ